MVSFPDAGVSCLEIAGVSHFYGQKPALTDVSLDAQQGEVLALLGPSGSGKSTLLAAIAGMVKPATGKIVLRGRDLLDLPPESRGLGMVFQDYALWPHMTVGQNVAFPLRARCVAASEINEREFDQGSPAAGMAMGVVAISVAMLSVAMARRLVPKKP